MLEWIKTRLVPEARAWWKLWSIRFNSAGLFILSLAQFDHIGVLSIWNMMPPAVTRVLPPEFLTWVGMTLFGLGMLARFVKQPKLEKTDG